MKDEQFTQILRAINNVREDVKEFKDEMNKRWKENERRWDENNNKWKENDKSLAEIRKELERIEGKVDRNYKGIFKVFESYEASVESMYQENKQKIVAIQKRLKMAKV